MEIPKNFCKECAKKASEIKKLKQKLAKYEKLEQDPSFQYLINTNLDELRDLDKAGHEQFYKFQDFVIMNNTAFNVYLKKKYNEYFINEANYFRKIIQQVKDIVKDVKL